MITGLTNRLGDSFLICLLGLSIRQGAHLLSLALTILLSITKSAQLPFSSWLPSAIAAPTPVRALVHSSTLVTAGVYVLIRYCQYDASTIMFIGSCTILMAGLRACAESDLKKVVALSTLSQLGVMMVSIGALEKSYCFFHLISHATFKALLFICIGTCIHTVFGTQDYRSFNLLHTSMFHSVLAMVANISLIGFIYTSGFYRKDRILEILYKSECNAWTLIFFLVGIGFTTCYSMILLSSIILAGGFSRSSSLRVGGHNWTVKGPFLVIGILSTTFGSNVDRYVRQMTITLPHSDKLLPLGLILVGTIMGFRISGICSPSLRRLIILTPSTQHKASFVVCIEQQNHLDKG